MNQIEEITKETQKNLKTISIIVIIIYVLVVPIISFEVGYKQGSKIGFRDGTLNAFDYFNKKEATTIEENKDRLQKEYNRGFVEGNSYLNHILFAGATFEYDKKYIIQAWDISSGKTEIRVLQNGDITFNGICYENQICNLQNISFQIDDIHIGKEASYFVYWSDK